MTLLKKTLVYSCTIHSTHLHHLFFQCYQLLNKCNIYQKFSILDETPC